VPRVRLLIFPFWTPYFVVWTPHFGWTPRLNYAVVTLVGCGYYWVEQQVIPWITWHVLSGVHLIVTVLPDYDYTAVSLNLDTGSIGLKGTVVLDLDVAMRSVECHASYYYYYY